MRSARILVVDDEITIRQFLARALERAGYQVQTAGDGQEALHCLETAPFDLILTDIKMNRMDGVMLLAEIRTRFPEVAVILLTGHATVQSAIAALRDGAANYLLKPIRNEEIVSAVAQALEKHAQQQARERLEVIASEMAAVLHFRDISPADFNSSRQSTIQCGDLVIDRMGFTVLLSGERLHLTPTEFRLLAKLAESPGVVFDFVTLVHGASGYSCPHPEAREIISTHVRNLRHKLGAEPGRHLYIESVRGVGYRLIPPPH